MPEAHLLPIITIKEIHNLRENVLYSQYLLNKDYQQHVGNAKNCTVI